MSLKIEKPRFYKGLQTTTTFETVVFRGKKWEMII